MTFGGRKATALLFIGDLLVFALSLWLTLLLRYLTPPTSEVLAPYIPPFLLLFAFWILVFYINGLYGKQTLLLKNELPGVIIRTQIFNIIAAAIFFFLIPLFGIAPKTNLAIYLAISLVLIFLWRLSLFPRMTRPLGREPAALLGTGPEVEELVAEVNGNSRYHLEFRFIENPAALSKDFPSFQERLVKEKISLLVVDTEHEAAPAILPKLYDLAFGERHYQFADFYRTYEEVFDRVPLSLLRYEWFLQNIQLPLPNLYTLSKRLLDIVGGILMGVVTIVVTPFVYVALRIESPGPLFIVQDRLGRQGTRMRAYKFRSMQYNDQASDSWVGEGENKVTRVGAILRKTSLDEFPQFLNILRGELSLIGPRNDIAGLGARLGEAIPYYAVRYVVRPGITGWAQINQRYEAGNISPQSLEETKLRLAYDFYYIKNRSFALDLVIALKTFKRMFFRVSAW